MKKLKFLIIILVLALLAGCGSDTSVSSPEAGGNVTVNDNRNQTAENVTENVEQNQTEENITTNESENNGSETKPLTDDAFAVKEYFYEDMFGDTMCFVSVKNNSGTAVEISANGTAKDAEGKTIGADDMSIDVLGPGEESVGYFYFDSVSGVVDVDYQLIFEESTYYKPVLGNLNVEKNLNDSNITITLTNKGDINAQFVEAYAFFFDASDNLVGYSSEYVVDSDSEIKPGASISAQLDCYEEYDHVELFLTGRSDGSSTPVSEADTPNIEVCEYLFEDSLGDTMCFLVFENKSSEILSISGNAVAKDDGGKVLGADDMEVDVIGPGEMSIGYFYFDSVSGVDNVEYQLSYGKSYYLPVLNGLESEESINSDNVIVTVTNNGTIPAEFLEAYALFFDADGNLISYNSNYVTDDDSELKVGATLSKQLDGKKGFDHVEVYYVGRYSEY